VKTFSYQQYFIINSAQCFTDLKFQPGRPNTLEKRRSVFLYRRTTIPLVSRCCRRVNVISFPQFPCWRLQFVRRQWRDESKVSDLLYRRHAWLNINGVL